MDQPLTLHWQSAEAYYTALLTPDLFGGWVLIVASGKRDGRAGRVQHKPMATYAKGLDFIRKLRRRKRLEGYALCGTGFMELEDLDPHSPGNRSAETGALLRVFKHWRLAPDEAACLLAVSRPEIDEYLDGGILPDLQTVLDRAHHLLAVHKALRHLFAGDQRLARRWLGEANARFDGAPPLQVMLSGLDGLALVRSYLEHEADVLIERPRVEPGGLGGNDCV